MVERQLKMRPNIPRPGDSRTQPTSACAVGDGLELHCEQEAGFITVASVLTRLMVT